jgi:PKD repeat protein
VSFALPVRAAAACLAAVVTGGLAIVLATTTSASATTPPARYAVNRNACATPSPDQFRCFALERKAAHAGAEGAYRVASVGTGKNGGYSPADLAKAYNYNPAAKVDQTVAIVDWYDNPRVAADLAAFDKAYGLPPETSRSFRKVNQNGRPSPLPRPDVDTATEISLDVQAVRAVCHRCRILLVEANSPTSHDLAVAENTAVRLGADEVSNSFGLPESGATAEIVRAFRHPGVVITASTGDDGWWGWDFVNENIYPDTEPSFPSSSPYVVAVGGTRLTVDSTTGARTSETVWNNNAANDSTGSESGAMGASGGGCSGRFGAGSWQYHVPQYAETRCGSDSRHRVAADLALLGDPQTGFDVRETFGHSGWITVGGTSLSAPIAAAMFALAGGARGSSYPAASLYANSARNAANTYDVTQGGNAFCGPETALINCMNAALVYSGGETNNPNRIFDVPLDCSFPSGTTMIVTPPAPARQCNATAGYDGPTGLGAPTGLGLFRSTSASMAITLPSAVRLRSSRTYRAAVTEHVSGARPTGYSWSWGDGATTSTTSNWAKHTYRRAGSYSVRLTMTDSLHQVVQRTRVVRVGLAPTVRYRGPSRLAAGRTGSFSAAGSHAVNTGATVRSIVWNWDDGHRSSATSRITHRKHRYARAGTYLVRLTVTDNTGVRRTTKHTVRVR